jgi:hypothetical protein
MTTFAETMDLFVPPSLREISEGSSCTACDCTPMEDITIAPMSDDYEHQVEHDVLSTINSNNKRTVGQFGDGPACSREFSESGCPRNNGRDAFVGTSYVVLSFLCRDHNKVQEYEAPERYYALCADFCHMMGCGSTAEEALEELRIMAEDRVMEDAAEGIYLAPSSEEFCKKIYCNFLEDWEQDGLDGELIGVRPISLFSSNTILSPTTH